MRMHAVVACMASLAATPTPTPTRRARTNPGHALNSKVITMRLLPTLSACCATLTLSLVAGACLATGATTAATAAPDANDATVRQYADLVRMQQDDSHCHWLDATSRVALDATAAERLAWVKNVQAATPEHLEAVVAAAKVNAKGDQCGDASKSLAVRYAAWQMRVTWGLRAQAMLAAEGRPAWLGKHSPVKAYAAALNDTVDAMLKQKYGRDIVKAMPGIESQALPMLALAQACPNRPDACPVAAPATVERSYARVWVDQATAYAAALSKAKVKLPPAPTAAK